MGVISVYHPDVFDFLEAKAKNTETLQYFNLSVMVDDDFMKAVEEDEDICLHYPVYDENWEIEKNSRNWTQFKSVRARALWDEIIQRAYNTGEPGVLFYDTMNRLNPTRYCESIIGTNPCGEYLSGVIHDASGTYNWKGACNLGSLMLPGFFTMQNGRPEVHWGSLRKTIRIAVSMLDRVIDKNFYPHKDYEDYQKNMRTIGLGITGLADLLVLLGLKYGEPDAVQFTHMLMNFIAYTAYHESYRLGKTKGAFPMCDPKEVSQSTFLEEQKRLGEQYDWSLLARYGFASWHEPDWKLLTRQIWEYGLRNARLLSVAPTGTMSLTFGNNCSSGLEPIFMLEQERYVKMHGQSEEDKQLVNLENPVWKAWKAGEYPHITRDLFVTALELPVMKHVAMLEAVAKHVDMSCSKTINIPKDYSFEDTKKVYMECWKRGIKGCTIFRPNPLRQGIFVTEDSKEEIEESPEYVASKPESLPRGAILQVDDNVIGRERHLTTGCGTLHFQAYFDPDTGELVETYASRGSQGGCNSYMVGLSRMVSLAARAGTPVDAIVDQLLSAPPCIAYNNRHRDKHDTSKGMSCAAAMGYALRDMAAEIQDTLIEEETESADMVTVSCKPEVVTITRKYDGSVSVTTTQKCPDCGDILTFEGGCNVCKSCGWSKCG